MALLDLTLSRPDTLLTRLASRLMAAFDRSAPPRETSAEEARNQRAFLQDMYLRNPQAFASEEDVHSMMALFSRRF